MEADTFHDEASDPSARAFLNDLREAWAAHSLPLNGIYTLQQLDALQELHERVDPAEYCYTDRLQALLPGMRVRERAGKARIREQYAANFNAVIQRMGIMALRLDQRAGRPEFAEELWNTNSACLPAVATQLGRDCRRVIWYMAGIDKPLADGRQRPITSTCLRSVVAAHYDPRTLPSQLRTYTQTLSRSAMNLIFVTSPSTVVKTAEAITKCAWELAVEPAYGDFSVGTLADVVSSRAGPDPARQYLDRVLAIADQLESHPGFRRHRSPTRAKLLHAVAMEPRKHERWLQDTPR